jgi:hypothetical protein
LDFLDATDAGSAEAPCFHLVPPQLLHRTAMHFTQGAQRYGANNFPKSLAGPAYVAQLLNHLEVHLLHLKTDPLGAHDDDLTGISWAVAVLMEGQRLAPGTLRSSWRITPADGPARPAGGAVQLDPVSDVPLS